MGFIVHHLNQVLQFLIAGDRNYFVHINQEWTNSFFDSFMPYITDFHQSWPYVALLIAVLVYRHRTKVVPIIIGCLVCLTLSDVTAARVIKPLVQRPRPEATESHVRLIVPHQGSFGFPSNHAANVFTIGTFLFCTSPLIGMIALIFAFVVAYSRVYVGVHYPLDVMGGGLLGIFWALIVYQVFLILHNLADPIKKQPVEPKAWEKRFTGEKE